MDITELPSTEFAPGDVVSVWQDGWRMAVVVEVGWKWTKLVDCSTLEARKVTLEELRKARRGKVAPAQAAALIRRMRATFKRCKVSFRNGPVKAALAVLERTDK